MQNVSRPLTQDISDTHEYPMWRDRFAAQRLTVLYPVGLIANPIFGLLDFLAYPDSLRSLFLIRIILELGLLIGFLSLRQQTVHIKPNVLVTFWILFPNVCIVHMTVLTGGFSSQYYNGLSLVMLAAAVIVPVSWRSHLAAQLGTILYYYCANLFKDPGVVNVSDAIQNSFFLIWTCVALIISVTLYERLQRTEFRTRRELESSNQKLLELDRLKSEFFANISHELRTPLTLSIAAYKALLASGLPSGSQDMAKTGLRNAVRLVSLINELLDLAKFDSGYAELKKRSINLAALVRDVASNFESSSRQRIQSSGLDTVCAIEADPRQIKKVLYNLLSNAFKFSDPERGQVQIRLRDSGNQAELEIEDHGIGIPSEQLDRIFDRFTQVEAGQTRRFEGAGIGLALVKEIVAVHGGRVMVESELGKGSIFRVVLPLGQVDPNALETLDEEESDTPMWLNRDHVSEPSEMTQPPIDRRKPILMVADDNVDMRAYLQRLLAEHYHVVLAKDGAEAFDKAQQVHPDLILTDVMMPQMSGDDLLKAVREHENLRSTPVIFLTAKAGPDARIESFEAGADDYVSKPFHEEELLARIKNQLRIRGQEKEIEARSVELERVNRQLEALNTELREVSQRKSEFVSIVSHDLRSPMAAIQGYVDNMLDGLTGSLSEKQGYYLSRIKANIERVTRMVSELLDLARIEAGQVKIRLESVSIVELVNSLLEGFEKIAGDKQVTLISHGEVGLSAAQCDPDKVTQIFSNLIQNALKFTPPGGKIQVELSIHEGTIRTCVADTGCGIPSSEIGKVFDKFYRGASTQTEGRGIGLGLAIVKHLVELQRGTIWVESQPGHGSRFYFTLPLSTA
jgi:signal transduction histidine kinase